MTVKLPGPPPFEKPPESFLKSAYSTSKWNQAFAFVSGNEVDPGNEVPAGNEAPDVTRERPDFGMVNPLGLEAVREVNVLPVVERAPPPVRGSPA
jgi:hypothetical protein